MLSSHYQYRSRPLLVCIAIFLFGTVLLFSSPTRAADEQDAVLVKFEVQLAPSKSGSFILAVHSAWAPLGAERFLNLVDGNGPQGESAPAISGESFWNGLRFFRVIDGFMAQFGIAPKQEVGASWFFANLKDDPVIESNKKGYVSFATSGEDSRTTQMFINFEDNSRLDDMGFAPFANVVQGMDIVDQIYSGYGDKPDQGRIQSEGNSYLEQEFPSLSYIKSVARVDSIERQAETDQQCSSLNNCSDCVSAVCSWAMGECFDDCMQVADAACYSLKNLEGKTAGEICKVEDDSIKDSKACGALSSCYDCVETSLPSDGSKRCMWFEQGDCMSGCGMDGCGVSQCSAETAEGDSSSSIKPECTDTDVCGGFAGFQCDCACPGGTAVQCVDDPSDSCDPAKGGADCMGMCTCPADDKDLSPLGTSTPSMFPTTTRPPPGRPPQEFQDAFNAVMEELEAETELINSTSFTTTSATATKAVTSSTSTSSTFVEEGSSSGSNAPTPATEAVTSSTSTSSTFATAKTEEGGPSGSNTPTPTTTPECGDTDVCGGLAGFQCDCSCPGGTAVQCVDDSSDSCDPEKGGRDCMGICTCDDSVDAPVSCNALDTCSDCVEAACSWTGECYDDCMGEADAACYSFEYFKDMTSEEVCKVDEDRIKDSRACSVISGCNDCVETSLPSDGSKRCMWSEQVYCMSGCGMDGCGVSECSAETDEGSSSGSNKPAMLRMISIGALFFFF